MPIRKTPSQKVGPCDHFGLAPLENALIQTHFHLRSLCDYTAKHHNHIVMWERPELRRPAWAHLFALVVQFFATGKPEFHASVQSLVSQIYVALPQPGPE